MDDPRSPESIAAGNAFRAEVAAAREKLAQSAGWGARQRWSTFDRSVSVWSRNSDELQILLGRGEHDGDLITELLQNTRVSTVRENFFAELDQRLQNLVASARSLVEHTRTLVRKYPDSDFEREFTRRNKELQVVPSALFLDDLRNYILHVGHVPIRTTTTTNDTGAENAILLERDALLSEYNWKPGPKKYLTEATGDIHLSEVVRDYRIRMHAFCKWVSDQFDVLHADDWAESKKLEEQANLVLTGGKYRTKEEYLGDLRAKNPQLFKDEN
ncbi:MAG: hypothetical protein EPN48_01860 [Microbacteriaceae bacterium]|nr:MAG: hypothetical protein EPN48_01860 [Microbacteriaceae bacterium]